jgi:hypothetical protein
VAGDGRHDQHAGLAGQEGNEARQDVLALHPRNVLAAEGRRKTDLERQALARAVRMHGAEGRDLRLGMGLLSLFVALADLLHPQDRIRSDPLQGARGEDQHGGDRAPDGVGERAVLRELAHDPVHVVAVNAATRLSPIAGST